MRYIDNVYLPMAELVEYLYDNGFEIWVISGTERTTTRAIVANSPISQFVRPEHVIGTDFEVKQIGHENESSNMDFKYENGDELVLTGGFIQKNLNANKSIYVEREIGQRPVLAFGNSGSDTSMMNYTIDERNPYLAQAYMVVADDNVREWGKQDWDQKSADYRAKGYVPISMKSDFAVIYPEGVTIAKEQYVPFVFDAAPVTAAESDGQLADAQDAQPLPDSPAWVTSLPAAQDEATRQLFIVAGMGMDKTTASVSMHQRGEDGSWKQILSTPAYVGKNGLCLDADHAEGCGQTPIGVYGFNKAFGIAADPGCAIPYFQVDDNTYWSGDPDRFYNQMVDIREVPDLVMDDSEHILDYEYQYQYCLNISFNEEGTPGRGSAIFLHCLGPNKPYTGGCVAVPQYIMEQVMQCVTEDCVVVIDTLENLGGSL